MERRGIQKDRGKGLGNHKNSRKGRSKSRLGKIECWNCGKKGHMKKYYKAPKKQRDGQREKNQEANLTSDMLQDALILSVDNIFESWVVYSEDSFHATPHVTPCFLQSINITLLARNYGKLKSVNV